MQASPTSSPAPNYPANPPVPYLLDDLQWVTAYLTVHSLSDTSRWYTYFLWIAVGVIVVCFSIFHALGLKGGFLGAYWSKWAIRRRTWRKKHSLAIARKRGEPHRQPKSLPSNAQILTLVVLILGTLVLSYVGPDYLAPGWKIWNVSRAPSANISKRDAYDPLLFIPFMPKYTVPKAWWASAARTGQIAYALLPLCVLFALKSPPFAIFSLSWLTNLHFDKLSFLHRWCGVLVWFITTLHVVSWSVQLSRDRYKGQRLYQFAWSYEKFMFGWIAYGLLTLIIVLSVPPLRKRHYESFYFLHILLVPIMLVLAALHHPLVWWWPWAALGVWLAERLYRFGWWLYTNGFFGGLGRASDAPAKLQASVTPYPLKPDGDAVPMHTLDVRNSRSYPPPPQQSIPYPSASSVHNFAVHDEGYIPPTGFVHAELLTGKTTRLRIVTPGSVSWAPGQHFLINIPAVCWLTTHPFTAASICDSASTNAGREIVLLVRAKKGWTKDLWDTVAVMGAHGHKIPPGETLPPGAQLPPRGVLMRAFVEGPFGSSVRANWGDYSSVLLVAGGSGVSFALSVLEYLCLCMAGRDARQLGGKIRWWGKPKFKTSRVRFVWLVREFGHIQWCASALRRCMAILPSPELQIDIFVTNMKPTRSLVPHPQVLKQPLDDVASKEDLAPPTPHFVREDKHDRSSRRHSRSPSVGSMESDDDESLDGLVDLSYYEGEFGEDGNGEDGEHILDLTNFDDDDDTALPGEAQLNLSVKQEGKWRRSFMRRSSVAVTAKQELDKRSFSMYEHAASPSSVRLLDLQRPSSLALPALEPIGEHTRLANQRSPLSLDVGELQTPGSSTDLVSPRSATTLLPKDRSSLPYSSQWESPRQTSPPPHPHPRHSQSSIAGGANGLFPLSRPASILSSMTVWSDANSLAALVSEASAKDQIRLELDDAELADISVVAERARPGKPKLDRILADEVEQSKGAVMVGCCGPTSLNALIRKNIAAQIDPARIRRGDMRGHIALVAEDFSY